LPDGTETIIRTLAERDGKRAIAKAKNKRMIKKKAARGISQDIDKSTEKIDNYGGYHKRKWCDTE
jgi:hypothetical protein